MRRVSVGALMACVLLGAVGIAAVQAATLTGNIGGAMDMLGWQYRLGTLDVQDAVPVFNRNPELPQARQRRLRVGRTWIVHDAGSPNRQRRKDGRAMGDGFVRRQRGATRQGSARPNADFAVHVRIPR